MRFSFLLLAAALPAAEPDWKAPQSPPKPAPANLKFIDQGANDPKLKGYQTPAGFKLEIVAESPAVINPVGMAFGPDGALYVIDQGLEKAVVKKLACDAETGKFAAGTVVLELPSASRLLVHDGWLYVTTPGAVQRWSLAAVADGKHPTAASQLIAKEVYPEGIGFTGPPFQEKIDLAIARDGFMYLSGGVGRFRFEGADGSRTAGQWSGEGVVRCRPDGTKLELFASGLHNPHPDLAVDRAFHLFQSDSRPFKPGRLLHVVEAGDYSRRGGPLPAMHATGDGGSAGLFVYNDAGLPPWFCDQLWQPDPRGRRVRAFVTKLEKSTFRVAEEYDLIRSDDPAFWPSQLVAGPDGAVYLNANCRRDTDSRGGIYRLTWTGGPVPVTGDEVPAIARRGMDAWAKIAAGAVEELVKALAAESLSDRHVAWTELGRRGVANRPAVLAVFADPKAGFDARAAALAALEAMWNDDVRKAALEVFDETDTDLKRLTVEAFARRGAASDAELKDALIRLLGDHAPALRRAAAFALAALNPGLAAEAIVINVRTDTTADPFLADGYLRALERCGKFGVAAVLNLARSGNQPDRDRAVDLFAAGRSREMAEALPDFLLDPHLTPDQRAALIASAANYRLDPPAKWDALLTAFGKLRAPSAEELAAMVTALAETDSLAGPKAVAAAEAALASDDPKTRAAAVEAINHVKLTELMPSLLKALVDKDREVPERKEILWVLRSMDFAGFSNVVRALDKSKPPAALRAEALRALSDVDPDAAALLAADALDTADVPLQTQAVIVLSKTPAGAKLAGQRFLDKKLSRELLPEVSEGLRRHAPKDAEAGKLLTAVLRAGLLAPGDPASVEQVRQLILTKGDAGRGRTLYLNSAALACATCHKMEGVGGQAGPDLTRLWDTMSIEKIFESMIDPSKEIKEGYQSYRLVTTKGRTHTGLKITETKADVTIREAGGADVRVPTAEVEELTASKVSLMPDNVVSQLSFDQFVDLVAFLKNRQAQEYLRQIVTEFTVRGPVKPDATAEDILRLAPRTASAQPNGVLNLRTLFPTGDARAVVEILVRSPKEQTVQFFVSTDGPATLSLNHRALAEITNPKPFGESERISVTMHEGWQTVWVDVKNRKDAFRLSLRALGQDLKIAVKQD